MFGLSFSTRGLRELKKFPKNVRRQVSADLDALCKLRSLRQSPNVIRLEGAFDEPTYRLRSGNYRVIFFLSNQTIVVLSVRDRKEGYH